MSKDGARFQDGNRGSNRNEDDDGGRNRDRRDGMDGDTQRAMVCVAVQGMNMGDLHNREQSQQNEAHDRRGHESSESPASSILLCAPFQHRPLTLGYTRSMPVVPGRLRYGTRGGGF